MSSPSRFPASGSGSESPGRPASPPFCHVARDEHSGRSRHYVVHTASPKFVVEFEEPRADPAGGEAATAGDASGPDARARPVIRRVCVPNSWAGDYHQCARQLGAAAAFFESARARQA